MTHHHHDHDTVVRTYRGPGILTIISVLVLLLAAVAGALWISHSGSATEREDQERAAVRTKNLADLRAADQTALTTYGWSDKAKGIIHIPVTRAMELVVPELNSRSTKGASSQTQQ
jgi:flagellar basal body-associated protein FliL